VVGSDPQNGEDPASRDLRHAARARHSRVRTGPGPAA
jgi:hypothetical protein